MHKSLCCRVHPSHILKPPMPMRKIPPVRSAHLAESSCTGAHPEDLHAKFFELEFAVFSLCRLLLGFFPHFFRLVLPHQTSNTQSQTRRNRRDMWDSINPASVIRAYKGRVEGPLPGGLGPWRTRAAGAAAGSQPCPHAATLTHLGALEPARRRQQVRKLVRGMLPLL